MTLSTNCRCSMFYCKFKIWCMGSLDCWNSQMADSSSAIRSNLHYTIFSPSVSTSWSATFSIGMMGPSSGLKLALALIWASYQEIFSHWIVLTWIRQSSYCWKDMFSSSRTENVLKLLNPFLIFLICLEGEQLLRHFSFIAFTCDLDRF